MEKLYSETLKLIKEFGLRGWTIDTVCQKCGIAKDTFYRIMKNKETLVRKALIREVDTHLSGLFMQESDKDFMGTLKDIVVRISSFFLAVPTEKLAVVLLEYPTLEKEVNDRVEKSYGQLESFLVKGKDLGKIKKSADLKFLLKVIHGCIMQFVKDPGNYNVEKDINKLLDYLIEGIRENDSP